MAAGRFAEAEELLDRGLTLARQRGDRQGERRLQAASLTALVATGRWDDAIARTGILSDHAEDIWAAQALMVLPYVLAPRGDRGGLERILDQRARTSDWPAEGPPDAALAVILRERGDVEEAVERAAEGVLKFIGSSICELPLAFGEAVETAFSAGKPETVEMLLGRVDQLRPAQVAPMLDAEVSRARARLAAHRGDVAAADRWFRRALGLFEELGTPFLLARVQLQYAEALADAKSDPDQARALRGAAAAVFEALDAAPWLARAHALESAVAA
jgi:tetratricopeptide (TPR) repeat protein